MKILGLAPLSTDAERLLAQERYLVQEPAELRLRVLARAQGALQDADAPPRRAFARRRPGLLLAAALVIAFAAVSWAAFRERRVDPDQHVKKAPPAVQALAHPAPHTPAKATPAAEPAPSTPTRENVAEPAEKEAVVPALEPRPLASASDYALELASLQRARAAVADGEYSKALSAIAEHQRRFSAGRLREERDALRIKALVGLGRTEQARRAAERFREHFPRSVLLPRIEEAIRQVP